MEPARQLLPIGLVSNLASFGRLGRFSDQHCFRSSLVLNWWLAGLLVLLLVVAVGPFVILVTGLLVVPFAGLEPIEAWLVV